MISIINKYRSKKEENKGIECLNCGQPLTGKENFCSYCGQKNSVKKLSFSLFISNILSGLFNYDSRFWQTFIPLLLKPGKVSKEFIEGKRARFVNPFQLYLNVSIVFFLVMGLLNVFTPNVTQKNTNAISKTNQADSLQKAVTDSILKKQPKIIAENNNSIDTLETITNIKSQSFLTKIEKFWEFHNSESKLSNSKAIDSLGYKNSWWNQFYFSQTKNIKQNIERYKKDNGKSFAKTFTSYISISLFIFLPIFTLFLWLLYVRRSFTYIEHLIFVFHVQTVFFLLLLVANLLNFALTTELFTALFLLVFWWYLYKAMKRFYEQNRTKTVLKLLLLNGFYSVLGLLGIGIIALLTIVES